MDDKYVTGVVVGVGYVVVRVLEGLGKFVKRQQGDTENIRMETKIDDMKSILLSNTRRLENVEKQTDDLHEWHNVRDVEGRLMWYSHPKTVEIIERIVENMVNLKSELEGATRTVTNSVDVMNREIKSQGESASRDNKTIDDRLNIVSQKLDKLEALNSSIDEQLKKLTE